MKVLVSILTLLALSVSANAQSLPKEFGKYRRTVSEVSNNPLIEKIASNGVFVISQSYQLEDSLGKFFGLAGKKEFGSDTSIGVMIKNGYLLTNRTRVPWEYDQAFKKVRRKYIPQLFPTQYSEIANEARYDSIYYDASKLSTVFPDEWYALRSDIFFNDGFTTGHASSETKGFLIWILKPSTLDFIASTALNFIVNPTTLIETEDRSNIYNIPVPETQDEILGAIYLVPEITGVGRVDYILHGISIKDEYSWGLVCPFDDSGNISFTNNVGSYDEDDVQLTPNEQ
jgi:hypothetical protein